MENLGKMLDIFVKLFSDCLSLRIVLCKQVKIFSIYHCVHSHSMSTLLSSSIARISVALAA